MTRPLSRSWANHRDNEDFMYQHIKTEAAGGVARLILARAPLNILNMAMMREINDFLDSLADDSNLKVILIKAEGKAFSAGVDVSEHLGDQVAEMIEAFHGIFRRLAALGLVSVAQVQGAALGGGCELAIYADLVVASQKAKFGQPEIQVGVLPPIACLFLPRMIGPKKALELVLTGQTISAAEAKEMGLVNQVVPSEGLEEATDKLVSQLAKLSAVALKKTKKAALIGLGLDEDQRLAAIERLYLEELMASHDAEEGLRAFLEKRKPIWQNR